MLSLCAALSKSAANGRHAAGSAVDWDLRWACASAGAATTSAERTAAAAHRTLDRHCGIAVHRAKKGVVITPL